MEKESLICRVMEEGIIRFSIYRYEDDKETIYLADVFVDEGHRGKGYGNEILTTAEKTAKQMGAKSICLKAEKDSFAYDWYTRHGFQDIEQDGDYMWLRKNLVEIADLMNEEHSLKEWMEILKHNPELRDILDDQIPIIPIR